MGQLRAERAAGELRSPRSARYDLPPERVATASDRLLPSFVIIGTQKGGTSSLYHYLSSHPDCAPAFTKEVHFFNRWHRNGIDWYRAFFPLAAEATIAGEASPNYLVHPASARRLAEALPTAKVIAMLRNPVDRAFSQYWMQRRCGHEARRFDDAIDDQAILRLDDDGNLRADWSRTAYRSRGLYAEQIDPWLDAIAPDNVLILRSEDFFADPAAILAQVQRFIGMRPWQPGQFDVKQDGGDYDPIDPERRARLTEWYEPHNRRLYDLIGRDMGWERDEPPETDR